MTRIVRTRAAWTQLVAGCVIVAIAFVHLAVTFVDYSAPSLRALWFAGSGFALLLIGGLNVIAARLEQPAFASLRELRGLTLVADACGVTLGVVYIVLTGARMPQGPVLVAAFAVAAVSQLVRRDR